MTTTTTPEHGRDGLREEVLTRGERETLESYLVALWQCKTERGYNEFVGRVLDYAAQIKAAGALIAVDDFLAEHPATGDEERGLAVCDIDHGHEGNPARVYGHHGSPRTCIRLKATDQWAYDPAWETTP
jgi:hypothetical protein